MCVFCLSLSLCWAVLCGHHCNCLINVVLHHLTLLTPAFVCLLVVSYVWLSWTLKAIPSSPPLVTRSHPPTHTHTHTCHGCKTFSQTLGMNAMYVWPARSHGNSYIFYEVAYSYEFVRPHSYKFIRFLLNRTYFTSCQYVWISTNDLHLTPPLNLPVSGV